jgi:Ca2+-binding RTX toxin-like protein
MLGADTITGGNGNDELFGGPGDDHLSGDNGNDVVVGNFGSDTRSGGNGDDFLDGALVDNTTHAPVQDTSPNTDTCSGGSGNNTFFYCETQS